MFKEKRMKKRIKKRNLRSNCSSKGLRRLGADRVTIKGKKIREAMISLKGHYLSRENCLNMLPTCFGKNQNCVFIF